MARLLWDTSHLVPLLTATLKEQVLVLIRREIPPLDRRLLTQLCQGSEGAKKKATRK